jgi:hypothetical protein
VKVVPLPLVMAGGWPTVIKFDVPVIEEVVVSVAVTVCVPMVLRVTLNVPAPPVSVEFAGNTALPSVLEK